MSRDMSRSVVSRDMSQCLETCLGLETVSGHDFSKSRSRRYEVLISVSSRDLEVSENELVSCVVVFDSSLQN